ncbi:MAG: hypothetical protein MUC50_07255 [Myxococcota bacterium]|jgi:hypothetical protein|nr:hypothetical protein [Myxococcota bacterium]
MLNARCRFLVLTVVVLGLCVLTFDSEAFAGGANKAFAGKVVILAKVPPMRFSSEGAFVSFLRHNSVKTVSQNIEGTWEFETMAFFKRPLGDYEVEIVFYDVTNGKSEGQRRFVNSYTQFTQDRTTQTLSGKTKLIRPDFDANKTYMIVAQNKGVELARGEFSTRGITQAEIDSQKRFAKEQAEMEKSMKDLQERARQQQEAERKRQDKESKKVADNVF